METLSTVSGKLRYESGDVAVTTAAFVTLSFAAFEGIPMLQIEVAEAHSTCAARGHWDWHVVRFHYDWHT